MSNLIENITGEQILDSRGNPTLKVTVSSGGVSASFAVPSGASTGSHEAHELRDADGHGVSDALNKINVDIVKVLIGQDVLDQANIDKILIDLDGTKNKDNLGGNSMLGVSIACAKVAAKIKGVETFEYLRTLAPIKPSRTVPYLYMNLINGGKHAKNGLAFQEYLLVPDTTDPKEAVEIGLSIENSLKEIFTKNLGSGSLVQGDEGGFAPNITDVRMPLVYLSQVVRDNNLEGKVRFALDVASSSFYKDGAYVIDGKSLSKEELASLYISLMGEFGLLSIEDPFYEEDFESFHEFKVKNSGLLVVGDDLTVTNKDLVTKALENDSINAMIIKPNQIGTLSETLATMKLARDKDIELIVSHRSGETEDDFIADLAYAFGTFGLKAGSPVAKERMKKYQRLIDIVGIK